MTRKFDKGGVEDRSQEGTRSGSWNAGGLSASRNARRVDNTERWCGFVTNAEKGQMIDALKNVRPDLVAEDESVMEKTFGAPLH